MPRPPFGFLYVMALAVTVEASPAPSPAATPAPCSAPEYRQFDFWIGRWNVYGPDGRLAGTNDVTREFDGCVGRPRRGAGIRHGWTARVASCSWTGS